MRTNIKTKLLASILLILFSFLTSCKDNFDNTNTSNSIVSKKVKENQIKDVETETTTIKPTFEVQNKIKEEQPSAIIYLIINNKKQEVAKVNCNLEKINRSEYVAHGIPKSAIEAYYGWWAGSGDYFYMTESSEGVAVYQGWQDEEQEDVGCHWKKIKSL
jgi:hypothetical protein